MAQTAEAGGTASFGDEQLRVLDARMRAGIATAAGPLLRDRIGPAVARHPQLRAAQAGLAGTAAATREAQAQGQPQVSMAGEAGLRRSDASSIFGTPKRTFDNGSMSLVARQIFIDFGAVRSAAEAGRERERAVGARTENRRNDLALQALQAWSDLARSRERLALLRLNVQALEQMIEFLARREALGAGARSDVWRAQARLADARAALAGAAAAAGAAEAAWIELFGADSARPEQALPGPADSDALAALQDPRIDWAAEHPAVRSAIAARSATELDRDSLMAAQKPQISGELSATRRDWIPPNKPGTDLSAQIVLRHNFYTGGGDDARRDQATSRVQEAGEQLRSVRQQVERALAQTRAEALAGQQALAARREAVAQGAQALRAVRELFANRRGTLLELLAAQEALHAAGLQLVDIEAEATLAQWRLLSFDEQRFAAALGLQGVVPTAPNNDLAAPRR